MLPEIITSIPGPRSRACAEKLARFEAREVTLLREDFPVFWEGADGVNVWDVDGNRFLDFTSAFAVSGLGHGARAIRAALQAQGTKLLHAMGDVHPAALKAELCSLLSQITFERWGLGGGKSILCNSGSEAVEAALKTALLYSGKAGVISFTGGYHGLGFGALETIGIPTFREPFQSQLGRFAAKLSYPNCFRCPFGRKEGFRLEGNPFPNCSTSCLEQLERQIVATLRQREIGAILVEPIQGRGGEIVPPRDFLSMLRWICDNEKVLLILDETIRGLIAQGNSLLANISGSRPISSAWERRSLEDSRSRCALDAPTSWTPGPLPRGRRSIQARLSGIRLVARWQWLRSANISRKRRRGWLDGLNGRNLC